jgi:hypothetical protein
MLMHDEVSHAVMRKMYREGKWIRIFILLWKESSMSVSEKFDCIIHAVMKK